MLGGYAGTVLRVHLTQRRVQREKLEESAARRFIGGRGLGGYYLWKEVGPQVAPLSPENKIFLCVGPVTSSPVPGANRYVIVTRSPQTGLYLDSYGGGHFGPELKFAGYDMVVLEGKALNPVYLWVDDDRVEIRDATHLWGKDTWDTEEAVLREVGDSSAKVCVIGPAGERLSNLAIVQNEYYHQAGRGGAGAVFGSKNVKAIAVRGRRGVKIADAKRLIEYLISDVAPAFESGGGKLGAVADRMKFGTPLTLNITHSVGILPTRNFQDGQFSRYQEIDSLAFRPKVVVNDKGCFACNLCCAKFSRNRVGPYEGEVIGGPEYETLAMFGSNLGIDSLEYIVHANALCDRLGVDTVGTGNIIGWVMECFEKGILNEKDIGFAARFGDQEASDRLIRMIANREGIGDLLANGVRVAAHEIGRGSEEFAMEVKGLEFPAYRPGPCSPGFALAYLIADRGGCHRRAWPAIAEQELPQFSHEGRARLVKYLYDQRVPWHCALCCDIAVVVPNLGHKDAAAMFSSVIGWDLTADDMGILAERVASLLQACNIRFGLTRESCKLPSRSYRQDADAPGAG
ncbi:MAG TPA: aldehyde ferredoxin oxidoreductase, partial [Clostridiales bacterium]|nr:aldehyde ferredoxin oxidoreductase [Clostridiales bacterium]